MPQRGFRAYNGAVNNRPGYVVRRRAGEPAADLTEHRVVHRGIEVDLRRLAAVADDMALGAGMGRWPAFGEHLSALALITRRHLRVDNGFLAEVLIMLTGESPTVPADATPQLCRLLVNAEEIATASDWPPAAPVGAQLATVLTRAARIAGRLFDLQERVLFPLIVEQVRAADYRWVQEQFRAELPAGLLAFFVPWTMSHATSQELPALNDPTLCVTHRIFAQRFAIAQAELFG